MKNRKKQMGALDMIFATTFKKLVSQIYNVFLQIYKKKLYVNNNTEIENKWVFINDQYTHEKMLNFSSIHGTVI